jgi:hypothetical protein
MKLTMRRGLDALVTLAFLCRAVAQPVVKPTCYDNSTVLLDDITAKEYFQFEEYILCPNTVFRLGTVPGPSATCCIDGMSPLAARSHTSIKCGESGASSNNCTFVGAEFQVISSFFGFLERTENVRYQGLTLQGASYAAILLENDGDVSFTDCIVMVRGAHLGYVRAFGVPRMPSSQLS